MIQTTQRHLLDRAMITQHTWPETEHGQLLPLDNCSHTESRRSSVLSLLLTSGVGFVHPQTVVASSLFHHTALSLLARKLSLLTLRAVHGHMSLHAHAAPCTWPASSFELTSRSSPKVCRSGKTRRPIGPALWSPQLRATLSCSSKALRSSSAPPRPSRSMTSAPLCGSPNLLSLLRPILPALRSRLARKVLNIPASLSGLSTETLQGFATKTWNIGC